MFNEPHELADEFPELKQQIHDRKAKDEHFAGQVEEYHRLAREARRIEQEIETVSDTYAEGVKKRRLHLKDEIFAQLKKGAA
jgi:uncharacterized protein YdcH (DUF465 family)